MKEEQTNIRNQARRPVSIRGNSGSYCHIDPLQMVQLPAVELEGNQNLKKLLKSGVLSIVETDAKKKTKTKTKARASKKTTQKRTKTKTDAPTPSITTMARSSSGPKRRERAGAGSTAGRITRATSWCARKTTPTATASPTLRASSGTRFWFVSSRTPMRTGDQM